VETGNTRAVFDRPAHPYTAALLSAVPAIDPAIRRKRILLAGEIPSPATPPAGCRFHTRCPQAQARCAIDPPVLRPRGAERQVRCHFPLD
jgi:peptide/nickel transport system ATP-binding protein